MNLKYILLTLLAVVGWRVGLAAMPPVLLADKPAMLVFEQALTQMYSLEFERSAQTVRKVSVKYAQHPAYHVFLGLHRYWWKVLGQPYDAKENAAYRKHLYDAVTYSDAMLDQESENLEATFFVTMAYGMLARQDSEAGDYMKALSHARKAYIYMKRGFGLKEKYDEFYFSTGLYFYYREFYPEVNPVYKPFMAFFVSGNKMAGLRDIEISAGKSVFMRTEALTFLSHIYLHYENQPAKALQFARPLYVEHPQNLVFGMLTAEVELANNNFAAAETIADRLEANGKPVYVGAAQVFRGIIAERHDRDDAKAKIWYDKALATTKTLRRQSDFHKALAYAGLARIAKRAGNKTLAKKLYSASKDQAYYVAINKEAEALK
ncbi:hypothetical protein SAMN05421780_101524 [Flexibacter flexilis DSM 6793]|uniref:Tetratricopeptide repeat-containing protein n=1 Tax=Flexibacter flexilis DSM 6793 TaxID=927664 RepID=A0A1I1E433_9BACT|nr:hypothetical protein [Flexibacter flexilis]SFB79690.1 hypothetical protein SAMN05421780_101524 [Flexibacter flexilis DSM 6793]